MRPRLVLAAGFIVACVALCGALPVQEGDGTEVFVQLGHASWVNAHAMSNDGRLVASGSVGGIKLWDVASGRELLTLDGHSTSAYGVAFSPDAGMLASCGLDKRCVVWSLRTGKELFAFDPGAASFPQPGFSADGRYAFARDEMNVTVVETSTGRTACTLALTGGTAVFSPTGRYALARAQQTPDAVAVWDLFAGSVVRTLARPVPYLAAITADEQRVVSVKGSRELEVWELMTGRTLLTLAATADGAAPDVITSIRVARGGALLLAAGAAYATLYDLARGRELASFRMPAGFQLLELSPDGRLALLRNSSETGNTIFRVAETRSGYGVLELSGKEDGASDVSFAPDGRQLIVRGMPWLSVWDLDKKAQRVKLEGQGARLSAAIFAPDGKRMSLLAGRGVAVWDLSRARLERTITTTGGAITAAVFSPSGALLATGGADKSVRLWDLATGTQTKSFVGHADTVTALAFTPDGRRLVSGSNDATVRVWDIDSGAAQATLAGHAPGTTGISNFHFFTGVLSVAVSPSGDLVASGGSDGKVILWGLADGGQRTVLAGHTRAVTSVAFSPDGAIVASGGLDDVVRLWSVAQQREVRTLTRAGSGRMTHVEFSRDGRALLTRGSDENASVLWDLASGKPLRAFVSQATGVVPSAVVVAPALSPDGRRVLAVDPAGAVARLWDAASGAELARFTSFLDGEWIAITPAGYYASSPRGDTHVNVRIGTSVYGVDSYREAFFRPDLVTLAIGGGSLNGFGSIADVGQPPRVRIVNAPATTASEQLAVIVEIEDQGGGIGDVRLYLNDAAVVADSTRGVKVASGARKPIYRNYLIKVPNGPSSLRAVAFNADNTMQSNEARHELVATLRALTPPSLHALVVGIDEFKNPKLKLKSSVADAHLFADTLTAAAAGLFQKVSVTTLVTPAETTRESIVRRLEAYRSLSPDDVFVFYVASHGTVDDGEYFLITANVGSTRTESLRSDAISQTVLKDLIANIPATKKLIVLDTCNAGALGDAIQVAMLTRGMSEDTAIKILSRAMGSTILSASTSVQEALEGYNDHGLFTYVLAEGLRGRADKGRTGFVKTTDLADYVDAEVPAVAERVFHRAQYPTISVSGQGFPIGKVAPGAR